MGPYSRLYQAICTALTIPRIRILLLDHEASEAIAATIMNCEWWQFYDICEVVKTVPDSADKKVKLTQKINTLFQEERLGYKFRDDQIEKIGSEEFDQAILQAIEQQQIGPRFEVPLHQLNKALTFRNSMPPDYPNSVKEAVNAVEGVWQVIKEMPGTALPTVLSNLDPPLPDGLKKIYIGLYGYGSGSEGARHAGVGGHTVDAEEAELIVHCAAAAISYAISKFG